MWQHLGSDQQLLSYTYTYLLIVAYMCIRRLKLLTTLLYKNNDLLTAWAAMCVCVGGRSLIVEVCSVCRREAALQSRVRSDALLLHALHTVRHCLQHHQCRTLVLKVSLLQFLIVTYERLVHVPVKNESYGSVNIVDSSYQLLQNMTRLASFKLCLLMWVYFYHIYPFWWRF